MTGQPTPRPGDRVEFTGPTTGDLPASALPMLGRQGTVQDHTIDAGRLLLIRGDDGRLWGAAASMLTTVPHPTPEPPPDPQAETERALATHVRHHHTRPDATCPYCPPGGPQ